MISRRDLAGLIAAVLLIAAVYAGIGLFIAYSGSP